jgi:copper transport protein
VRVVASYLSSSVRSPFAAACCVLLWTACNGITAHAHANLLQTEPASGVQLDKTPDAVRLYFNERVETIFNSIKVFDGNGRHVEVGDPHAIGGGDALEILVRGLKKGPYTVRWRVNSLDGHQVDGHFGFGVQSPPPTEAEMNNLSLPQQGISVKVLQLVVKWIVLAAMTTWLGGMSFWILIFEPCIPADGRMGLSMHAAIQASIQRTCRILWGAALLFILAQFSALVGQGMIFANIRSLEAFSPANVLTILTKTSYGSWWSLRMLAALGMLVLCPWKMRLGMQSHRDDPLPARSNFKVGAISGLFGSVMLLTIPMSGHARAVSRATAVAVTFDWAHLVGTAIWIGGLVFLWAVVLLIKSTHPDESEFLSRLVSRFSKVARICVLVLVTTGIYAAWLHMPSWKSFVSTQYGLALLAKLILVTTILLIALVNWRRVLPALAGFSQQPDIYLKWAGRFRTLITSEAALGIVVLVVVAILTSLPPATAVSMAGPIELTNSTEGTTVDLKLDSTKVGTAHSIVTLHDSTGKTISDAKSVTLFARMLGTDMGLETIEAQPTPSGSFQADVSLTMAGKWSISVQVAPWRGDAFVTEFQISSSSLQ